MLYEVITPLGIDFSADRHVVRPRYLIEDYAVAYLPSASVLGFAMQKDVHRAATARIVVV